MTASYPLVFDFTKNRFITSNKQKIIVMLMVGFNLGISDKNKWS